MATAAIQRSRTGYEAWQDGINKALNNPAWDAHDCDIRIAVSEYNQYLSNTQGYIYLDWKLIKAMLWVESGAKSKEWKVKPMQIGVNGDPGLNAFLSDKEGGELILPPSLQGRLNSGNAKAIPYYNIRAGIGYMLMRMANYDYASTAGTDTKIYEIAVKPGDSLDKIARTQGTTIATLKKLNLATENLRPGQILKYYKASVQKVILGWNVPTSQMIASRYNGGKDKRYSQKLDYALAILRQGKGAVCLP